MPTSNNVPGECVDVNDFIPLQSSVANNDGQETDTRQLSPPATAVISVAGQLEIVGGSLSYTVTCWINSVTLPASSIRSQITFVVPNKNVVGALLVIVISSGFEQLSAAVGSVNVKVLVHVPGSTFTVTLSKGKTNIGASSSVTVKLKLQVFEYSVPPMSWVAVQVIVFTPFGINAPAKVVVEGAPTRLWVIVLLSPEIDTKVAS